MPVYEYACKSCGHHLEVSQSFTDDPLTTCPVCAGPLRKVFSSIGIVLKGSGFYRTDSRTSVPYKGDKADKDKGDKKEGGAEKSDSKSDSKAESKSDAKAESKSDAKADTSSSTKSDKSSGSKPSDSSAAKSA